MPFEVFDKRWRPAQAGATVTIQRSGAISFTRSAWALIESPPKVILAYDPDTNRVAIGPANEHVVYAYPVQGHNNERRSTFVISGKAFLQYYGIDHSDSRRRDALVEDGMLVINLNDSGTVVAGRKSSAAPTEPAEELQLGAAPQPDS